MKTKRLRYSEFAADIDVDQLYEAIGFVPDRRDGNNDIGQCIWPENHKNGDTTGKFAIERENKLYNCFVCEGGNLLSLAMEFKGLDVDEATEWLYQFAHGDTRTDSEFTDYLLDMLADVEKRVATMPYFNERVLERFDGPRDYFYSRGISDVTIDRHGLRYQEFCTKVMVKNGVTEEYIGPASIWPHYWQGKLVGWQYRWSEWDKEHTRTPQWLPKWTNTSEFPKSTTLYNYDSALKNEHPVIVCESLGTCMLLETWGFPAVAWFGSKPTDEQFRLLRRFQQGVILAPDNDSNEAGDKIYRAIDYLQDFIPVYVADKVDRKYGDGADLGDYVQDEDPYKMLCYHLEKRTHLVGLEV